MGKECSKCKCMNPEEAHYCANCGHTLEKNYWRDVKYKVVKENEYNRLVSNLKNLQFENYRLLNQINNTWSAKIIKFWKEFKGDDSALESIGMIVGLISIIVFIWFCVADLKSCSSEKKISRFEINGKYGIGYDSDNLIIAAKYDSISNHPLGNIWGLYNKSTKTYGIAYVTDSLVKIIEPNYLGCTIYKNRVTVLTRKDASIDMSYKGGNNK